MRLNQSSRTLKNKKQSAPEAYKKEFRNQGLTHIDKNGRALLKVRCPQSYKEGGKGYTLATFILC